MLDPLPEPPLQPEPGASWFMKVESLQQQLVNCYFDSPVDTVNAFRGDSNAANSCYSLRILESCIEPGHLANGNAVHNRHVSITYQLKQRQMTLI